jgi:uncharacterized Zn finger protein
MTSVLQTVFSAGALRRLADRPSFERGAGYADAGRVKNLKIADDEATASVRGTRQYRVRLWLEKGAPAYSCTCPVGEDGLFCKHCVAVGLKLSEGDAPTSRLDPRRPTVDLRRHLEGLDKSRLVELLLEETENDELLQGRLLLEAAKAQGAGTDLEEYRLAIEDVMNPHEFVDYRSMYDYSRGIEEVIDSIEELLESGHAAEVVELCEHALASLEDALGSVDDSNGYMGGIKERLSDLHLRACVKARPDPEALAYRLFEWALHSEWETFYGVPLTYARVLGKRGLAVFRKLAEEVWARVPAIEPGHEREHSTFRFNITHIMESLAEQSGDLDELVSVKARDLSSAYSFVQIAELYRTAGRHDDALGWAERGVVAYPERTDSRLLEILAEEYERRGRHGEAMELMWSAFADSPGLNSYQRLRAHADRAGQWETWRARSLDELRQTSGPAPKGRQRIRPDWDAGRSELVKVFLWEGDVDAAWREAVEGGCSVRLWMELAEKREADHPEDALPIYQEHVERLIDQKNNQAYAEAVDLMRKVKELMARLDREQDFPAYVDSVRTAHKPKRNLMKLVDQASW